MVRANVWIFICAALLLAACEGKSDNVTWEATFSGSQSSGTSSGTTGGAVVQATNALTFPESFVLEEPLPFTEPLPPPDLAAIGEALLAAGSDLEVVDAAATPLGTAALYRDPTGEIALWLLTAADEAPTPVPSGSLRVILADDSPLRLKVVLPDHRAILATHAD